MDTLPRFIYLEALQLQEIQTAQNILRASAGTCHQHSAASHPLPDMIHRLICQHAGIKIIDHQKIQGIQRAYQTVRIQLLQPDRQLISSIIYTLSPHIQIREGLVGITQDPHMQHIRIVQQKPVKTFLRHLVRLFIQQGYIHRAACVLYALLRDPDHKLFRASLRQGDHRVIYTVIRIVRLRNIHPHSPFPVRAPIADCQLDVIRQIPQRDQPRLNVEQLLRIAFCLFSRDACPSPKHHHTEQYPQH